MKKIFLLLLVTTGLICTASAVVSDPNYLSAIQLGAGSISLSSGVFNYSAGGSVYPNPSDIAYIPISSPKLTTANNWQVSLSVTIPSLSLKPDDNLSFGLAIGTNGIGINTSFINLYFNAANHAGTTLNDVPDYTYGDFAVLSAQNGLGYYTNTLPKTPFSTWNGSTYYQIDGATSPTNISTYSSQSINGSLQLSYDGNSVITGYFNGIALGSYNISSWGSGNLIAAVYGSSEGVNISNVQLGSNLTIVPEPSTYVLFGLGAVTVVMILRRKKIV